MLRNYLKITLRNISRHKIFSFINIAGLSIGIACCLLLLLWVQDELSYDRFHTHRDSIYRVIGKNFLNTGASYSITHPAPIGPKIQEKAPEVLEYARIYSRNALIQYQEKGFYLRGAITDPALLKIFTFPLVKGDPNFALNSAKSVVLNEKTAAKLFGDLDPIGKTVKLEHFDDVFVTGVMQDIPANSHLTFDYLLPMSLYEQAGYIMSNWGDSRFVTYVQLSSSTSPDRVVEKIRFLQKERWPNTKDELQLQALSRIHLYNYDGSPGAVTYVYIFSIVAALILLIACINFMNLATARSSKRGREIGLRKVVGAQRFQIIRQLMGESILFTLVALVFAVTLVSIALPAFNNLASKVLKFAPFSHPQLLLGLLAITVITGILAGSYPALFLSSFRPVKVLKSSFGAGVQGGSPLIRKILVVFQFTLSIALIVSTIIIYKQISYMKSKNMGITKDNILCLKINNLTEDYKALKNELSNNPNIINSTATFTPPAWRSIGTSGLDSWDGRRDGERISMDLAFVDYDYLDTFDITLAAGRGFSQKFTTDANETYIINEAAARALGMHDPIGKNMSWNNRPGKIIGVIKDFHLSSLHNEIQPLGILILPQYNYLCIKIRPGGFAGTMEFIKDTMNKFRPGQALDYKFMDEWIDARYRAEERMGKIIRYFTALAIFISCLGLLGLASFTAEQRTKEIGIRKVLGATMSGIVMLLSKDFLKWVLVANIIAWPVAYYFMKNWLLNFAYRTSIQPWIFFLSASVTIIIALVTISVQSLKAAMTNPIDSLHYE